MAYISSFFFYRIELTSTRMEIVYGHMNVRSNVRKILLAVIVQSF